MVGVRKTVFSRVFELLVFVLSIWPINETPRLFTIAAHLCGWEWRWRKRNWIWIWRGDAHKPSFGCSVLYTFSLSHTFHLCCFSWIWCALENLVLFSRNIICIAQQKSKNLSALRFIQVWECCNTTKRNKNDEYNNQFYTHTHTLIERLLRMSGACNSLVNLLSTKRAQRSIKQQIVISTNSRRNEKNLAISLSMPSCFIIRVYDERTIQLDLMPKNAKLANNRRWTS